MYSSPNFNGKVFVNPVPTTVGVPGGMLRILTEYVKGHPNRTPAKPLGPFKADAALLNHLPSDTLRITWLGHSTLIIEIDGKRFLTDPVWAERVSPFTLLGPKRFFSPPLALNDLPPLDGIILSHDHYDHLDKTAVKWLAKKSIPFYVTLGVEKHLIEWGISSSQITTFDWWQEKDLGMGFKLIAAPARHFSGRGLTDRFQSLWASYIIQGTKHKVYFGADSGMHPLFKEIGDRFGPFDVTILEIGAYDKLWEDIHMGPDNAVQAHLHLRGNLMLPIHWGTFNLAFHPWTQPVERFMEVAKQQQIDLLLPRPGATYTCNYAPHIDKWWED
ncbi:MAG: MBL fold metallo-hydrolase [Sphingobacteriaceae bacterium]